MAVVPGDCDVMNRCVDAGEEVAEAEVAAPHLACPVICSHLFEAGRLVVASLAEVIRSLTVTGPVTQYPATSATVRSSIRVMSSYRPIPFSTVIVRCRKGTRAGSRSPGHGSARIPIQQQYVSLVLVDQIAHAPGVDQDLVGSQERPRQKDRRINC